MKQLSTTLLFTITTCFCLGQSISSMQGTWVRMKTTIDNQELYDDGSPDTIIIDDVKFEHISLIDKDILFRETGKMTIEKDKIILTKRTTSPTVLLGEPPDIYYMYKLEKATLIIGNPLPVDGNIETFLSDGTDTKIDEKKIRSYKALMRHYRKIKNQ